MEKQKTLSRSIIILGLFSFITSLSGESTNLALPTISHALAITNNEATWIVQIGLITTTILLVAFGHLGDILSKELIFLVGGILFTAGSLINGLSPKFYRSFIRAYRPSNRLSHDHGELYWANHRVFDP